MRFASHRDIARAVERGVRKAGLPIAYSAGFTPHPKISYAGAAATGVASEAEYLELTVTSPCRPEDVRASLDAALPDGIDVVDVTERGSEPPFARLEASQWQVTLPGVPRAVAEKAIAEFLAASRVEVERLTKKGPRRMDARAAVVSMELDRRAATAAPGECEILRMVVRHLTPAVRPDDILAALTSVQAQNGVAGFAPSAPPVVTRLAQCSLDPGSPEQGSSGPGSLGQGPFGAEPLGQDPLGPGGET
jgi:radical SAM-linked protein